MTLSEAIRLGAMAIPAHHGPIFNYGIDRRICGACAIGTIVYAVLGDAALTVEAGGQSVRSVHQWIGARWPFALSPVALPTPGATGVPTGDVVSTMIVLFEHYHWTREQIVDWVETIEQQQACGEALQAWSVVGVGIE